jgi:hypothetical protein
MTRRIRNPLTYTPTTSDRWLQVAVSVPTQGVTGLHLMQWHGSLPNSLTQRARPVGKQSH